MDINKLEDMQRENPNSRFMVHDGFLAWSYGSPENPKLISKETAVKILWEFEKRTGKDAIDEMKKNILGLVYAEESDDLYYKTGNNRIIGLYEVKICVFEDKLDKEKVYEFYI